MGDAVVLSQMPIKLNTPCTGQLLEILGPRQNYRAQSRVSSHQGCANQMRGSHAAA